MSSENRTYGKHLKVTGRIFTLSNFISFTRLIIAFPIIAIHYQNEFQANITIVVLVVYAALSDYLDGLVARLTNTVSEMGKIIDPVADKLAATALFAYTVWIGWVPEWFLLFSILRDGLIMMGSYYIRRKYEKVAMSVLSGKLSVNVMAIYWVSVFFFPDMPQVHAVLLGCSVTAMIISFFDYLNRYRSIMQGNQSFD